MAKKDQVDTGNIDLDDFDFDIPEFDSPDVDQNSRKPITRALKGAVRGVKENIKDPATLRRFVSMAMPEGYGLAADTLDNAITGSKELYDKITGDSPELIRNSKSFGRSVKSKLGKVLPDRLSKKLDAALEEDPYSGPVKSDAQLRKEQEDSEIAGLTELLRSKTAADETRLKGEAADKLEGKALENARFESSTKFLSSINRGIARLVGYQDKINLKYQQKSLELMYRQYSTTKQLTDLMAVATEKQYKILEEIKHNTALPEVVKVRGSEMFGQLAKQRLMGNALNTVSNFTQNYRKQAMDNVSGMIQGFLSPLQDAHSMTEGMDKSDLAGWAIGKEFSDTLLNHGAMAVNPWIEKNDKIRRTSEILKERLTGIPQKLNEVAQSETVGTGPKALLKRAGKALMPKFSLDSRANIGSHLELDEAVGFDKIARRSLIEVIPGHLAEIAHWTKAAATGEVGEKQVYSVVRGGFTTESENLKDAGRQIMSRSERDSLRQATDEFLKQINGDTLSSKAQRILKRKILDEVANGKDLKPERLADAASYPGEDAEAVDEITSLLVDTFGLDWEGNRTDQSTEGKAQFTALRQGFLRMASMIPAAGDRIRILSDTMGKDTFRKLGYIERNGREDRINYDKIWNSVLDDEDEQSGPGPAGNKKVPPGLGGNRRAGLGGDANLADDLIRAANGGDRADDAAGKGSGGRPTKVNLDKYLGEKSLLIRILKDSAANHTSTVRELIAIHGLMDGWQANGIVTNCCGEHNGLMGPMPGGKNGMMQRASLLATQAKEKGRGWASRAGGGLADGMGWLANKTSSAAWQGAKLAGTGYWKALKGSAELGWGMSSGLFNGARDAVGGAGSWLAEKARGQKGRLDQAKDWANGQVGRAGEMLDDAKERIKNVYIRGENSPRLLAWKLKAGLYRDQATGKVIKTWDDVKGNVLEGKDKVALKYDEFVQSGGLRDAKGKLVKKFDAARDAAKKGGSEAWAGRHAIGAGLKDRAMSAISGVTGGLSAGTNLLLSPYKLAGKAALAGHRRVMKFFTGGKAGADISSQLTGDHDKDMITLGTRQAQVQYDIYKLLRKMSGMDVRKGSWQDIFKRREAEGKEKAGEKAEGKYSGIKGLFGKGGLLAGLLGGKRKGMGDEEEGGGDTNIDLGDSYGGADGEGKKKGKGKGKGKGGKPKKLGRLGKLGRGLGRAGGWALDSMGWLGKGLRGAGTVAKWGGKAAWGLTKGVFKLGKFALMNPLTRMALKGVGRVALGALVGAGSLLSAPIVGAALAAWTVYEIGSYFWQRYKDRMPPLSRYRFAQYGFAPRKDTEGLNKIFALEKLFSANTRVEESGAVSINLKAIPSESFGACLGFKIEPDNPDSQERLAKVMEWVNGRFKAVYSAHVAQLFKLNKSMDLTTVDEKVKDQQALDFLNAVELPDAGDLYNNMQGPLDAKLTEDSGDVADWFKSAKKDLESELAESKEKDKDKVAQDGTSPELSAEDKAKGAAAATALGANAASMAKMPGKGGEYPGSLLAAYNAPGKFTPQIGLEAALAGGATVVGGAVAGVSPDDTRLDFGNPVRYKVYGLTELAESKVAQLSQLEKESYPLVKYDNEKRAFISNETELFNKFVSIFGLSGKNQDDGYVWFYRRYLVAFLKYCTAIRARATIDAKDAVARLSNDDLLAVLKEMVSAADEDGTSVWDIGASPWEGYWLNNDRTSVDANLTGLATRTPPKILSEAGFAKADQVKGKDGSIIQQDPTQTNRPAGTTGTTSSEGTSLAKPADSSSSSEGSWWSRMFGGDKEKAKPAQVGGLNNSTGQPKSPVGIFPMGGVGGGGTEGGPAGATSLDNGGSVSHMGGGSAGDINSIPSPTGDGWDANKGTILAAAKMVGVDPELASSIAGVESNYNPSARPYSKKLGKYLSSAAGYYQVIKGTWQSLMERYGDRYGISKNATAMDPRANALLGLSYIKENYDILKNKISRKVTDTDVYLAHFLGSGGAKRFLVAPPGDPAINHVSAEQAAANPTIFYDKSGRPNTVAEVYNSFSNKLQKHRKPNASQEAAAMFGGAPTAPAGDQGSAAPEAETGGGGSFDPANMPPPKTPAAPSLAQPSGSNLAPPNSVTEPPPSAADTAASTTKVSQAAQQIGRQAEMADIQSSSQSEAMANSFGGVEGVLRDSLKVQQDSYGKLGELVELVSQLAAQSSSPGTQQSTSPSRESKTQTIARPAPQGVVKVGR